jgi:hypothetical protein
MGEVADPSQDTVERAAASTSSIEKFGQVILPALLGGLLGALAQFSIMRGYVTTPFSSETYLGGVLELMVILAFSIPAIILHTISQRVEGLSKMEFLGGGLAALLIFSLFGLLFSYCLLPVVVLLWFYASMSWSQHELPDFRLGFWAGLGCVVGTLSGSIAMVML